MRVAYIQSIGGASGDMLLAALVDLGFDLEDLRQELAKLNVTGYEISAEQQWRREVRGTKLSVAVQDHARYSPKGLLETVKSSALTNDVKAKAEQVLSTLWRAEARVHGEAEEALELEELGSVDTLVDVVGVLVGLADLGVERVYAAPLVLGAAEPPRWPGGYPNPAPATLELVAMAEAPVAADRAMYQGAGELTTPTGAALITTLATFERPAMSVGRIGVGLGTKDPENFPNVLRVWLGDEAARPAVDKQGDIVLLETNLDDVPGVVLGYTQERLFALGALDVWYTDIQMKKNRPGVILSVLVPQELEAAACELMLRETPTLGVRTRPVERYIARRDSVSMETDMGVISVKVKYLAGVAVGAAPEYEDCRTIALETGIPYQEVYRRAAEEARQRFLS
ncbi:MAG: TIGR00299 family protein [SAR202 cluster bacterium Io17-Chloro-G9]|nr:MAG: TIGR00299 family protein [SAR202 cluster bacterium Io17-Chloro-G9]